MSIDSKIFDSCCTVPAFLSVYEGVNDVALVKYLKKYDAPYMKCNGISGHYYLLEDIFYVLEKEHIKPRKVGAPLRPVEYVDLLERCTILEFTKTYVGIIQNDLKALMDDAKKRYGKKSSRYDYIKLPGKQRKLYRESDIFNVLERNGVVVRTRGFEKKYILRKRNIINA